MGIFVNDFCQYVICLILDYLFCYSFVVEVLLLGVVVCQLVLGSVFDDCCGYGLYWIVSECYQQFWDQYLVLDLECVSWVCGLVSQYVFFVVLYLELMVNLCYSMVIVWLLVEVV